MAENGKPQVQKSLYVCMVWFVISVFLGLFTYAYAKLPGDFSSYCPWLIASEVCWLSASISTIGIARGFGVDMTDYSTHYNFGFFWLVITLVVVLYVFFKVFFVHFV